MDIQFHGANCISLSAQGVRVIVDDNLADLGGKSVAKPGDALLFTGPHAGASPEAKLIIDCPGEYEIAPLSIYGIPARAHIDEEKQQTATMYKIITGDVSVLIVGHIFPRLNDAELERIGMVDVLIVPVGGNGYTLDPSGALELIKAIEPKIVIPTHYDDKHLNYAVPQQTLEQALQVLGMEVAQTTSKLRLKATDLTENLQLVVLDR